MWVSSANKESNQFKSQTIQSIKRCRTIKIKKLIDEICEPNLQSFTVPSICFLQNRQLSIKVSQFLLQLFLSVSMVLNIKLEIYCEKLSCKKIQQKRSKFLSDPQNFPQKLFPRRMSIRQFTKK